MNITQLTKMAGTASLVLAISLFTAARPGTAQTSPGGTTGGTSTYTTSPSPGTDTTGGTSTFTSPGTDTTTGTTGTTTDTTTRAATDDNFDWGWLGLLGLLGLAGLMPKREESPRAYADPEVSNRPGSTSRY